MSVASSFERQMLDLINQERTSRGLDPLTLELRLNESSEDHSSWMMGPNGDFSHTGANGSSAGDRMRDAGFVFSGSWTWGENIAYQSERGAAGISDDVADLHRGLMNSPGHRANILNPNFEVIGIGIEEGNDRGFDAVYVTQNFARTSAPLQLDELGAPPPPPPPNDPVPAAAPTRGDDDLNGTSSADRISAMGGDDQLDGLGGNDTLRGNAGDDNIEGGAGNDRTFGGSGLDTINGETGSDTIYGGSGEDSLFGDEGNDRLHGEDHDDVMSGGDGNDIMHGNKGDDRIYAGNGNDDLFGSRGDDLLYGNGGNDRLNGGSGDDTMIGGTGADTFVFVRGHDVVTDFNPDQPGERIDLSGVGSITGYNDLMSGGHIQQSGNSVQIDDLKGSVLTLLNTDLNDLNSSDFLF